MLTPCLGHIRRPACDLFERDAAGTVIFMHSWWRKLFEYGAQAYGKHQRLVNDVRVHPRVDGRVEQFKRFYGPESFKLHEAFLANSIVTIRVMVPDGLPTQEFIEVLSVAGEFRGISPYGWKDGYGRFEVVRDAAHGKSTL